MAEWRTTTLGELCEAGGGGIQTGPFGSQLHARDYVDDGIPSVMPVNIGDNVIDEHEIARVTSEDASRLSRYLLAEGDIVYSRRGDVERRALVRREQAAWLCGTGCLRVRLGPDPVADPRFVSYLLGTKEVRRWIVQHAVGATMPNLNTSILESVPLSVPDLPEQRAIAEVLGALDDKIAANTRLASAAIELAGGLFEQLMSGSSRTARLGEAVRLAYGKALPAGSRRVGSVRVYGSGGVVGWHDTALVGSPGAVVGRKGTAGAVHWAPDAHFPIDTAFYAVPTDGAYSAVFCYFLLRSAGLDDMNSDSAVPGLNRQDAEAAWVLLPDSADIPAFTASAEALMQLAHQCDSENVTLAATRDALLPALMSGSLRVRDAESVIADLT